MNLLTKLMQQNWLVNLMMNDQCVLVYFSSLRNSTDIKIKEVSFNVLADVLLESIFGVEHVSTVN